METVEENFRKLLNRATVLSEPLSDEKLDLYNRHKCQLVNSMPFYTTRIISDGMKFVMEGNAPSVLSEVLQKVHLLCCMIAARNITIGSFPSGLQEDLRTIQSAGFPLPQPSRSFSENGPKQWKPDIWPSLYA